MEDVGGIVCLFDLVLFPGEAFRVVGAMTLVVFHRHILWHTFQGGKDFGVQVVLQNIFILLGKSWMVKVSWDRSKMVKYKNYWLVPKVMPDKITNEKIYIQKIVR